MAEAPFRPTDRADVRTTAPVTISEVTSRLAKELRRPGSTVEVFPEDGWVRARAGWGTSSPTVQIQVSVSPDLVTAEYAIDRGGWVSWLLTAIPVTLLITVGSVANGATIGDGLLVGVGAFVFVVGGSLLLNAGMWHHKISSALRAAVPGGRARAV